MSTRNRYRVPVPTSFVPDDFVPPTGLDHESFLLRPLGPEHNDADYEAWTWSIDHIRATPGFEDVSWPRPMTPDENHADLVKHAEDFAARRGFTYTVIARESGEIIGCVYIYPSRAPGYDVRVRSWVRVADAELDPVLYRAVLSWLVAEWPFEMIDYAARPAVPS